MRNTVKINGKEYKLKSASFRAMFMFEEMTGKSVSNITTLKDNISYLYCNLKSTNEDFEYEFDEFIDELEKDTSLLGQIREAVEKK